MFERAQCIASTSEAAISSPETPALQKSMKFILKQAKKIVHNLSCSYSTDHTTYMSHPVGALCLPARSSRPSESGRPSQSTESGWHCSTSRRSSVCRTDKESIIEMHHFLCPHHLHRLLLSVVHLCCTFRSLQFNVGVMTNPPMTTRAPRCF